jgi:hypothetical protein
MKRGGERRSSIDPYDALGHLTPDEFVETI